MIPSHQTAIAVLAVVFFFFFFFDTVRENEVGAPD